MAHHCSVLVFPLQKLLCWKCRNFLLRNIALVYFTLFIIIFTIGALSATFREISSNLLIIGHEPERPDCEDASCWKEFVLFLFFFEFSIAVLTMWKKTSTLDWKTWGWSTLPVLVPFLLHFPINCETNFFYVGIQFNSPLFEWHMLQWNGHEDTKLKRVGEIASLHVETPTLAKIWESRLCNCAMLWNLHS